MKEARNLETRSNREYLPVLTIGNPSITSGFFKAAFGGESEGNEGIETALNEYA